MRLQVASIARLKLSTGSISVDQLQRKMTLLFCHVARIAVQPDAQKHHFTEAFCPWLAKAPFDELSIFQPSPNFIEVFPIPENPPKNWGSFRCFQRFGSQKGPNKLEVFVPIWQPGAAGPGAPALERRRPGRRGISEDRGGAVPRREFYGGSQDVSFMVSS